MLVDQRRPQLIGIDHPGHRRHLRHRRGSLLQRQINRPPVGRERPMALEYSRAVATSGGANPLKARRRGARNEEGVRMERNSREWLVPLTGIAFVVLLVVSFIVQGSPKGADKPAAEIANWYLDNKDAAEVSGFLGVVAATLLIFFGAYLRKVFEPGAGPMLSILPLIGVSIVAVGGAIDGML